MPQLKIHHLFFQTSVTSVAVLFQRFDGKEGRRFSHQQQHLLGPRVRCGHQLPLGEQGADLRGPGLWHRHVSARAPPWAASWAWEVVENARLSRFERLHRERYIYTYIYKRIFRWSEEEFSWFNMFQHEICTTGFELYDNGYLDSALFCITSGHRVPCCWCLSHFVSPREAQGIQLSKNPVRMVWTWRNSQQIFDWSKNRGNTCVDPRKSEA